MIQPLARALLTTSRAMGMASRSGASLGDGWARIASSARSGSLSLTPKPLPLFHGLSTGVGTYCPASQAAMSVDGGA